MPAAYALMANAHGPETRSRAVALFATSQMAGVAVGGKSGPKDYNLSDEAQTTVLLLDMQHKVLFNQARRAPERQDFDEVRKANEAAANPRFSLPVQSEIHF